MTGEASNQTQLHVEVAVDLVTVDWVRQGLRTLEQLYSLADQRAEIGVFNSGPLPQVMVRSESLRRLRERVPEIAP